MNRIVLTLAASVTLWGAPAKKIEPTELKTIPGSRRVVVDEGSVVAIYMKEGYQTLFMLPPGEKVLDVFCGNKGFVVIDGAPNVNFVLVKPSKAAFQTNLNIMTVKGTVYSFLITVGPGEPDLKVFVEPKEGSSLFASAHAEPLFISKEEVEQTRTRLNKEVESAKEATVAAEAKVSEAEKTARLMIDKARGDLPGSLNFDYHFDKDRKPFFVKAMYSDEKFLYIKANPAETPVLYALVEGKPAIVQFKFKDGLYTVGQVLDRGYLAIGKERLHFTRQER